MILCYSEIKEALRWGIWTAHRDGVAIGPEDLTLNPNSINVSLGDTFLWPNISNEGIDPHEPDSAQWKKTVSKRVFLKPGDFVLAHVRERFNCAEPLLIDGKMRRFIPMIEGRSTLARCGLSLHQTAGFGDVGFASNFTIELSTVLPIILRPGDEIGQVYFIEASSAAKHYSGAYSDQHDEPRPPKLGRDRFQRGADNE